MTAKIHCIRHAQGYHNLSTANHTLTDPHLTPHGESQCATLRTTTYPPSTMRNISLITASPLTRTLHTAYLTFQPLLTGTLTSTNLPSTTTTTTTTAFPPILALPDAQETSDFPCDTGSPPPLLASHCTSQAWPVDLSLLTPAWTTKGLGTRYSPASGAIAARARDVRRHLRRLAKDLVERGVEEPEIVVVTHGGFLHYLTGDWEGAGEGLGTGWRNCEAREFEFEAGIGGEGEGEEEGEARLVETEESRRRRGKEGPMKEWEEQRALFVRTMEMWEGMGLQRPDRIGEEGYVWKSGLGLAGPEGEGKGQEDGEAKGPGERQVESLEAQRTADGDVEIEKWEGGRDVKVQA